MIIHNTIPIITFDMRLLVRDRGRIIADREIEPHSFVRNWYVVFLQQSVAQACRSANGLSVVNTAGVSYSSDTFSSLGLGLTLGAVKAGAGVTTFGLLVGTSGADFAFSQYAMQALIPHGDTTGKLSYAAMPDPVKSDNGAERRITWTRQFSNNTSGDITVREIGWAVNGWKGTASTPFLWLREVLIGAAEVALTPGQQLEVQLAIKLIYPETIS